MEKFRTVMRMSAALMLLTLPLLSLPLAFARLTGDAVPLYGLVKWTDFQVTGIFALAVILLFPAGLKELFTCRKNRLILAVSGIFALLTLWQSWGSAEPLTTAGNALFFLTVPVAAALLAPELRKIGPFFAGAVAILLIISGFTSEKFTGLTGNWNWTQGLITALLPALVLLFPGKLPLKENLFPVSDGRRKYFPAGGLLVIFFTLIGILYPDELSRGALAAAAGAGIWFFIRSRTPQKHLQKILIITAAAGTVSAMGLILFTDLPDTRFQIWKGAVKLFFQQPFTGAGYGQFSEFIRLHLEDGYFFSPFPAAHIDHAHNDLFHLASETGITGILFYLTAALSLLMRREKSPSGKLFQWIFTVLLFCGLFDQHNHTLLCSSWLAVSAGILLAGNRCRTAAAGYPLWRMIPAAAGAILIFAAFNMTMVNHQNSSWIRQGDLKLLKGDLNGAQQEYLHSLRQGKTPHALYQLSEISLIRGNPQLSLWYAEALQKYCGKSNYRHTQRLRAVAALQCGDITAALNAMSAELRNAPYSVINARFNRLILRAAKASPEAVSAADAEFLRLCRIRKLPPEQAERFSVTADDGAFPAEFQKQTPEEYRFFSGIFREIAGALILILAICGMGRLLLQRFGEKDLLICAAAGMTACGILTLLIPANILQYLIVLPAIPGGIYLFNEIRKTPLTAAVVIILSLPLLASALLPPSAWDEQVYQISLLKRYLAASSVAVLPDNPYSAYPSLGQLWLLPGVAIGGLCVPKLALLFVNGILLTRLWQTGRSYGKYLTAAVIGAIILSPLSWILLRNFYVESFIALYGFAGVLLLAGECRRSKLFLAGIMAGAAAAVKLTGIGVSLLLFILLISDREKRRFTWEFIAGGILAALPFFLRVWWCCGNPFYPYFSAFSGGSESAIMVEAFHRALGGNYGIGPIAGIFLNWFNCALSPLDYDGINPGYQFALLFVLVTGTAVWDRGRHPWILRGTAALWAAWIFWNLTAQQTRFLYPLLFGLAFLLIYGTSLLELKLRQTVIILLAAASMLTAVLHFGELKHFFLAWKNLREARKSPVHFAAWISDEPEYAEAALHLQTLSSSRTATLWDRRTLYLPDNVTVLMPGFQEKLTPIPDSPEKLYRILQEFDYLLIRPAQKDVDKGIEFVPGAVELNDMIMELFKRGRLTEKFRTSGGQIAILRIVPENDTTSE